MNGGHWLLGGFCLCLWGGEGAAGFADLDAYLDEMRRQAPAAVDSVPPLRSFSVFAYGAGALRDPFQPLSDDPLASQRLIGARRSEPGRVLHPLEQLDIEQLQMVGTLSGVAGNFVLLRGAGVVYRLQVGDYLGRDQGRIIAIGDLQVDVLEVVADGLGGWLERSRTLLLKKHS
ncbi:pilus assembly protein PilP [Pseudomonas sp. B11]